MSFVAGEAFRAAMSEVCRPVVVATTTALGSAHGTTVTAFTSLSSTPPLVAVSLSRDSLLLAWLRLSGRLGIHVLAQGQESIALRCNGAEDGKFGTVPWTDADGLPRIVGSAGWFACDIQDEISLGDHALVVGLVVDADCGDHATNPLVYARHTFGTHSHLTPVARSA